MNCLGIVLHTLFENVLDMCCGLVEVCTITCGNLRFIKIYRCCSVWKVLRICLCEYTSEFQVCSRYRWCDFPRRRVVTLSLHALQNIGAVHQGLRAVTELPASRCCVLDDWLAQTCTDVRAAPATQYKGRCWESRRARHERVVAGGRPPSILFLNSFRGFVYKAARYLGCKTAGIAVWYKRACCVW